ncbi:MAG: hypothetical protein ACLPSF_13840, partial [Methylocella sp.]
ITFAPSASRKRATVLLPDATPPVNPKHPSMVCEQERKLPCHPEESLANKKGGLGMTRRTFFSDLLSQPV